MQLAFKEEMPESMLVGRDLHLPFLVTNKQTGEPVAGYFVDVKITARWASNGEEVNEMVDQTKHCLNQLTKKDGIAVCAFKFTQSSQQKAIYLDVFDKDGSLSCKSPCFKVLTRKSRAKTTEFEQRIREIEENYEKRLKALEEHNEKRFKALEEKYEKLCRARG